MASRNDSRQDGFQAPPKKGKAPEPSGSDEKTLADLDLQDLMRQLDAEAEASAKK